MHIVWKPLESTSLQNIQLDEYQEWCNDLAETQEEKQEAKSSGKAVRF